MNDIFATMTRDLIALGPFGLGGILLIYLIGLSIISPSFRRSSGRLVRAIGLAMVTATESLVGVSDRTKYRRDPDLEKIISLLENSAPTTSSLSGEAEAEIVKAFREALNFELGDQIKYQLNNLLESKVKSKVELDSIVYLEKVYEKIKNTSGTVTIRGFVNLIIGIGFAFGALYILKEAVEIFTPDQIKQLSTPIILYFIGVRVSLALIVTLIAYFFLSLYRRSLEETKYYQNEMTNISACAAGLKLAQLTDMSEIRKDAISKLMNLDRNAGSAADNEIKRDQMSQEIIAVLANKIPDLKDIK